MNKIVTRSQIIVLGLIIFLFVMDVLLGSFLIRKAGDSTKLMLDERMLDIVITAADMTDGDDLAGITDTDSNNDQYKKLCSTLSFFQNNTGLESIYAARKANDNHIMLVAEEAAGIDGSFGDEIRDSEAIELAFTGTSAVDRIPYSDNRGVFYCAYSPVWASDGEIAGVIAADFNAEWYEKQLKAYARSIRIVCLLYFLTGVIIIFAMYRAFGGRQHD